MGRGWLEAGARSEQRTAHAAAQATAATYEAVDSQGRRPSPRSVLEKTASHTRARAFGTHGWYAGFTREREMEGSGDAASQPSPHTFGREEESLGLRSETINGHAEEDTNNEHLSRAVPIPYLVFRWFSFACYYNSPALPVPSSSERAYSCMTLVLRIVHAITSSV